MTWVIFIGLVMTLMGVAWTNLARSPPAANRAIVLVLLGLFVFTVGVLGHHFMKPHP